MKRPKEHVLEEESRQALKNLLPATWIVRDITPDYGLDMEVTIVEGDDVTNNVLMLQIKATEAIKDHQEMLSYRMETKHLKYYESYRLPVLILYYVKSRDAFYHLFAQRYIQEKLSPNSPGWRKQKTVTIRFPSDSKLENIEDIKYVATTGYFYIIQSQLNAKPGGVIYWLDGIPKSDNEELRERTLKALSYALEDKYPAAIDEFENILRVCTVAPTERMSLLLNLGNAYYSLSRHEGALRNYRGILDLTKKVSGESALEGEANALGGIGLIYSDKGDAETALKYLEDALKILTEFNLVYGKDTIINAIKQLKGD